MDRFAASATEVDKGACCARSGLAGMGVTGLSPSTTTIESISVCVPNKEQCPRGHRYDYVAPSGRGGRQCSVCHQERAAKRERARTHCRNGHPYPAAIQQRINDRQQRRYCPTCLANRKPRSKSQRKVQPTS